MIGEVLRVARIANDLSMKEVSQRANVSTSSISELEKEKRINPSIDSLKKICDVYNLTVFDVYMLDDYHNSLIGKKQKLEIYKLLLLEILKTQIKNQKKVL